MKSKRVTCTWEFYRDNCEGFKEPMRKELRKLDGYVSNIEAENAKLRELVRHMHTCLEHYEPGDTISCEQCPYDNETWGCDYERLMAELGIRGGRMSERIVATDGHEGHWYTGEAIDADEWRDADAKTVAEYAAKLRLAGDAE